MTIQIALVEDDPFYVEFLTNVIRDVDDFCLHCSALNRASAMALFSQSAPDILLVDLGLPDGSGIEVIQKAKSAWPQCHIVVVSAFGDRSNILAAIKAGADSYLLKGMTVQEIEAEIRVVHQGGSAISPSIAKELLSHVRGELETPTQVHHPLSKSQMLSSREHEVFILASKGLTYNEVAKSLDVSIHTVRSFARRVYTKLHVTSKTEALYELRRTGQITA